MASCIPRNNGGTRVRTQHGLHQTKEFAPFLAEECRAAERVNPSGNLAFNPANVHNDAFVYFYFGVLLLSNPGFVVSNRTARTEFLPDLFNVLLIHQGLGITEVNSVS
ncbi:Hypothetical predicted protein [Podarcis lilfordi]|uniref:Uncharacterized protein n=1 Tax=Podarcis lilfordi TaxID=74358 RepID=A0AA35P6S4_9SAUR|nr:Hypothetical predicted protein [Podarcis lilfordi]